MRPLVIEFLNEDIELSLLLKEVAAGRAGGFHFQGSMHAFMATVLLRMAGPNTLDGYAKPEPPNRKLT
jgi:hypothetical protein